MEWLLLGTLAAGLWYLFKDKFPPISETADAITLLNFQPFTLQPGRQTYGYYLAPSGLIPGVAIQTVREVNPNLQDFRLARRNIPIPAAAGSLPATADLWAIKFVKDPASQPITLTPESVLQRHLQDRGIPIPAIPPGVPPAFHASRQLSALLYAAAFDPTNAKYFFIPIAARQT